MNRDELRFRAAGRVGAGVLRLLGATWRVTVVDDEPLRQFRREGQPVILTFWHSRILPLAYLHRGEGVVVLVSEHGDGEYIARVIRRLGLRVGRGSSTRGGARGLRTLIRESRAGRDLAFTPDGPRGPARVLKPGVLVTARLTGAAIVPLVAGGKSVWRADSWDRMLLPRPFARLTLMYGRPMWIPRDASPDDMGRATEELQAELDRITDTVDGIPHQTSAGERSAPSHPG